VDLERRRSIGGVTMIFVRIAVIIAGLAAGFGVYLLIVALVPGFRAPKQPLQVSGRTGQGDGGRREGYREDVTFEVDGTPVSAWLYLPEGASAPVPCIVMSHGLGATKDAGLDQYAVRFREAGFAVLAFDYRFLGDSGGEPRQLIWIPHQLEDVSAAVEYARGVEAIDEELIALWGTSLSAGHVIVAAARDDRISCVCAQCPFLDGHAAALAGLGLAGVRQMFRLIPHGQRDLVRSFFGLSPHKIPLFGRTGTLAVLADDRAWDALCKMAADGFVNEACARILIRMDKYRPIKHASSVRCPTLLQVTDDEAGLGEHYVPETERRLGGPVEVIHYRIGHFDIYTGSNFERAVGDQVAFLTEHLVTAGDR
jgi:pimeloyl-ACP methyl ester carboxylesterase